MAPWRSLCPAAVRGDDHTSAVFCCHIKNSSKSCYWKTEIAGLGTCPLELLSSSTSFVSYHPTGQNCSALQTFPSSPLAKVGSARSWHGAAGEGAGGVQEPPGTWAGQGAWAGGAQVSIQGKGTLSCKCGHVLHGKRQESNIWR